MTAIAVNLEDEAKVESDPTKLISDDSGSDAEDINIENQSGTKFGTLKMPVFSLYDVIIF